MKEPSRLRTGKAQSPVAGRGASKGHQCGRSREERGGCRWSLGQSGGDRLGLEEALFLGTMRAADVI